MAQIHRALDQTADRLRHAGANDGADRFRDRVEGRADGGEALLQDVADWVEHAGKEAWGEMRIKWMSFAEGSGRGERGDTFLVGLEALAGALGRLGIVLFQRFLFVRHVGFVLLSA